MLRVTFEDGTVLRLREDDTVEVENFPPRDTPKAGWERTRDYPPEYRRCTVLSVRILAPGTRVNTHEGILKVVSVEHEADT
jgi:hypothetical protein